MSSSPVAANPWRANAFVAAARICSRRWSRGSRRTGATAIAMFRPLMLTPKCTCAYVNAQVYFLSRERDMDGMTLLGQGREAEVYALPDGSVLKLLRSRVQ